MAIIGKIRKHSALLVIIIGIALAAFILGDFVRKKPRNTINIGVVAGEKIPYREFETKAEEQIENYKERSGKKNLTSEELFQLRQLTWDQITSNIILTKEYDELGLTVSSDELFDLVQGRRPHPFIVQQFKNPKTGMFDPTMVVQFLQTLDQREPEVKQQWLEIEKSIKTDRLTKKYNNLIQKSYYLPKAFAKRYYDAVSNAATLRFITIPYSSVDDKNITLTDNDFETYYNNHQNEYEQDASRDIDYVVFAVTPSTEDRKKADEEIALLYNEFKEIKNNDAGNFVNANSDIKYDSTFIKKGVLPSHIDSILYNVSAGTIIAPFIENSTYYMAKLLDVQMRPDSMKISHILISHKEARGAGGEITLSKEEAKKLADSLLAVVKKDPKKFEELAKKYSNDPSAKENGGNLDWFTDGTWVPSFTEACVKGKIGDKSVVETDFGYHVINVAEKTKPIKKIQVALIAKAINPSNQTYQATFNQANAFAAQNTTIESFEKAIITNKLSKKTADYLKEMDYSIPGLENPRDIIRWAYNEKTQKGDVSLFEMGDKFVIATLKEVREKGTAPLEQVKNNIKYFLIRDKKFDLLSKKVSETGATEINQMASKLNTKVDTLDALNFASYNFSHYGPEPKLIGTIFGLNKGSLSKPIEGNSGVYVVIVDNFIQAPPTNDYAMLKMQLTGMFTQRAESEFYKALEESAKIQDNRKMFY